jgi:DNA-binding transcriptional regulator/RsmH inhibitor MraZ
MIIDENDNIALYDYETGCDVLEYCERLMALYPEDEQIAAAVQRTTGAAELVTADTDTWRVAISDVLRCYAKLEKDVVTVGVLNKAVLSSRAYWEKTQEELLQNPKVKAQQAKILRAAASGQKLPVSLEEKVDQVGASGADGTGNERPAAASASDGGRGTRLLSLRELGR